MAKFKNIYNNCMNKITSSGVVTRKDLWTYAMLAVIFVAVLVSDSLGLLTRQLTSLLVPVCCYIILAVSLNLTVGFLGELALGHAGFLAIGAYTSTLFSIAVQDTITSVWVRFPLALIIGGVSAGIFGLIIGLPVLRLRGDYLAIVTLAFGEIIKTVATNITVDLSKTTTTSSGAEKVVEQGLFGSAGLKNAPQDSTFIVAFILVVITVAIISNLVNSKYGRAITAMRDNRIAAEACGINITYHKILTFVISAFFAGIAGVLYGHNYTIFKPSTFDYNMSIEILVIVVLGGMGSIRGSIIAAIVLRVLPELLRDFSDYRMLAYSILLILLMLINSAPGLAGLRAKLSIKNAYLSIKNKVMKRKTAENGGETHE